MATSWEDRCAPVQPPLPRVAAAAAAATRAAPCRCPLNRRRRRDVQHMRGAARRTPIRWRSNRVTRAATSEPDKSLEPDAASWTCRRICSGSVRYLRPLPRLHKSTYNRLQRQLAAPELASVEEQEVPWAGSYGAQ